MAFPEQAGRERPCPKLEKLVGHRLFVRDTLSVALTIWFGSGVPSLLEPHARPPTIFGDELDAGGAGRILDEATIWLEAREAAKLRG
jgi:hypothetical protein